MICDPTINSTSLIVTSPETIITFVNDPNSPIPQSEFPFNCTVTIRFDEELRIQLEFKDLEAKSIRTCYGENCEGSDWLEIHDGNSSSSPLIGQRFCGKKIPNPIVSTGNELHLQFQSIGLPWKSDFSCHSWTYFKMIAHVGMI